MFINKKESRVGNPVWDLGHFFFKKKNKITLNQSLKLTCVTNENGTFAKQVELF